MHKKILKDMESLCSEAVYDFVQLIRSAVDLKGEAHVFLAGGNTPRHFYQQLATSNVAKSIPWGHVHIYFGDERNVPPDDPDSNYNMASQAFLSHINIDPLRIHRIPGELPAKEAALSYNNTLKYCLPFDSNGNPNPDLVLLGLGEDGHIASLFPDTDILDNHTDFAAAVCVDKLRTWRISITYRVINNANNIWLFVAGNSKRDIVDRIFNYSTPDRFPVERIEPKHKLTWYLDDAAIYRIDK